MYPTLPDWAQAALDFSRWHTDEELADKCAMVRKKIEADPTRDPPAVSYVLPAYNEEKLLLGALLTLATQTVQGAERIVVDNNSTDHTHAVAVACSFTVVEESRRGIARARQAGLEAARGTGIYLGSTRRTSGYHADHGWQRTAQDTEAHAETGREGRPAHSIHCESACLAGDKTPPYPLALGFYDEKQKSPSRPA